MLLVAVVACAAPDDADELSETTSEISVTGSCSTSTVRGLSIQIAREVDCMSPSSLVRLASSARVRFTSNAVLPYMHSKARGALLKVADDGRIFINSGYRTVAQQYLLYRWWKTGRCGITAAALPGRSNHESGRAVDLQNWSSRISLMKKHGWSHSVPGDPVHFDHFGSPDNRGKDVRAFQRLWNRNHPEDKIAVDGVYGAQTAARLRRAPAKGFKKGASCGTAAKLEVASIDGPDRIAPGTRAHYTVTIVNNDVVDWPAGSAIVTTGASDLYDAATWMSPSQLGVLPATIPAGGEGVIEIDVEAPSAPIEGEAAFADLAVVVGGEQLPVELSAQVSAEAGESADEDEDAGEDAELADDDGVVEETGGCSTGGNASWLVLLGLLALRRRRR
jgi:hypothetical protein